MQSYYPLNVEMHDRLLTVAVSEEFICKMLSSWDTRRYPRHVREAWRQQLREYLSCMFGCYIQTYGFCYNLLSPVLAEKAQRIMQECDGKPWA